MRDVLITLIVFGSLPLILRDPVAGILMWVWLSVMNPHTQGWGFAQTFPFAYIVAVTTMLSVVMARGPKSLPWCACTAAFLAFILWMNVTTPFALFPQAAYVQWGKVMKIMLMSLMTLVVIRQRRHIHQLIWILVLSLGYYGVKGGLFTLRGGGADRVWGPEGTFIGGNNEIALALIMTIPLMVYLYQQHKQRWLRWGLVGMMALSALAALGSYSRGALLAIVAMSGFVWLRSGHKLISGIGLATLGSVLLAFMPERWGQRMDSIGTYEADTSAMGRINAWYMAYNLAKDRFFGGGFEISEPATFFQYAPNPNDVHAAHSIYFQVLGEHGFVGLALYVTLGVCAWRSAAWIVKTSRDHADLAWAGNLAVMIQASLVGFAVGGAFLSLLYFDVPYYLLAAIVATRLLIEQRLGAPAHLPLPLVGAHQP